MIVKCASAYTGTSTHLYIRNIMVYAPYTGYRSKLTPHYERPYRQARDRVRNIGFQRVPFPTLYHGADLETVDTQKIVDVERCPIAVDAINEGNSVL
jgi:hypothetical protein